MRRPLRVAVVLVLVAATVYLGISWKYADGVTRVTRDPLKKTPAYVQGHYEDMSFGSVVPVNVVRAHPERAFLFIQCEDDHIVAKHHGVDLKSASANHVGDREVAL